MAKDDFTSALKEWVESDEDTAWLIDLQTTIVREKGQRE